LAEEGPEGTRYRLLETLREYGWEQLAAFGELAAVRRRHYDWYLQLALNSDAAASEPERQACWARLEAEIDNVRAALAWCQEEAEAVPESPGAEAGLRLVGASWWLWHARGHIAEGLRWLEGALDRGCHLPTAARAIALALASHLCSALGERDRSHSFMQAARREYEALLATVRREGGPAEVARVVLSLSEVTSDLDDLEAAWQFSAEARQLFEELQEPLELAAALHCMAHVALKRQDRQSARALLDERLAICRKLDNPGLSLIHALGALGHLERDEGNYARAGELYRESLLLRRELGDLIALAQSLEDLAGLASRQQRPGRAIRLLGAAEAFCGTLGARPPVAVREEYERAVAEGRAALGEAAFAAAWTEGRSMSLEEALAYALSPG
jgi:hypothetical protein